MSAADVLSRAQAAGVTVWVEADRVRYRGPKRAVADLLPDLRAHRDELMRLLATAPPSGTTKRPKTSTLGPDGRLHPRLAALISAYCKRHQFTPDDVREALIMAAEAADPAACWAFYEAADRGGDDRITCPMCARLAGSQCSAKGIAPVLDIPRRCGDYMPTPGDPDDRTGEQRWPGLME